MHPTFFSFVQSYSPKSRAPSKAPPKKKPPWTEKPAGLFTLNSSSLARQILPVGYSLTPHVIWITNSRSGRFLSIYIQYTRDFLHVETFPRLQKAKLSFLTLNQSLKSPSKAVNRVWRITTCICNNTRIKHVTLDTTNIFQYMVQVTGQENQKIEPETPLNGPGIQKNGQKVRKKVRDLRKW